MSTSEDAINYSQRSFRSPRSLEPPPGTPSSGGGGSGSGSASSAPSLHITGQRTPRAEPQPSRFLWIGNVPNVDVAELFRVFATHPPANACVMPNGRDRSLPGYAFLTYNTIPEAISAHVAFHGMRVTVVDLLGVEHTICLRIRYSDSVAPGYTRGSTPPPAAKSVVPACTDCILVPRRAIDALPQAFSRQIYQAAVDHAASSRPRDYTAGYYEGQFNIAPPLSQWHSLTSSSAALTGAATASNMFNQM